MDEWETAVYRIKIKRGYNFSNSFDAEELFAGKTKDWEIFPRYYPEKNTLVGVCRHNTERFELYLKKGLTINLDMGNVEYYQYVEPFQKIT